MILQTGSSNVVPDGSKQLRILRRIDIRCSFHFRRRRPIARLSQKQYMLSVILYDPVGEVGLAQKTTAVRCFKLYVCNLQPRNPLQGVEADLSSANTDIRVQRQDMVASAISPRDVYIANDA